MSETFEDFVYINDNVLDESSCKKLTDYVIKSDMMKNNKLYEKDNKPSHERSLRERVTLKDDYAFIILTHMGVEDCWKVVYKIVNDGYNRYLSKWPNAVKERDYAYCPIMKYHIVQQYQGYHVWHKEWRGNEYPYKDIVLAWHLSLTSHKNEGELEFKYYDKKIEPKAGRLIVWPAGFTHTHRGNSIKSDTQKHYMTGWWFDGNIRIFSELHP